MTTPREHIDSGGGVFVAGALDYCSDTDPASPYVFAMYGGGNNPCRLLGLPNLGADTSSANEYLMPISEQEATRCYNDLVGVIGQLDWPTAQNGYECPQ